MWNLCLVHEKLEKLYNISTVISSVHHLIHRLSLYIIFSPSEFSWWYPRVLFSFLINLRFHPLSTYEQRPHIHLPKVGWHLMPCMTKMYFYRFESVQASVSTNWFLLITLWEKPSLLTPKMMHSPQIFSSQEDICRGNEYVFQSITTMIKQERVYGVGRIALDTSRLLINCPIICIGTE